MEENKSNSDSTKQTILDQTDAYLPVDEHVEYISEGGKRISRRGIFLLPNLLTSAAMFCGFYSIVASIHGNFEQAVMAIFAAGFFDLLDGRVARLLNAQSAFGVEYDSLSDLISFGAAPALLAYAWGLESLGKLGWVLAFAYLCCAALRLARFNTVSSSEATTYFSGMASPAAAGIVTSLVWLMFDRGVEQNLLGGYLFAVLALVTLACAFLMISNIPYYSFKKIKLKGRVPFVVLLAVIFVAMLIATDPPLFFFGFGVVYAFSGIMMFIYQVIKTKKD